MTSDLKKEKGLSLDGIKQRLYQAEAEGNHLQIRIWKAVLAKVLAQQDKKSPLIKHKPNPKKTPK